MSQLLKNFEWIGFHKLLRRIVFRGVLVNVEPLRIGAGKASAIFEPVDLVVVKVRDATGRIYPYVPGSSLKGVFRSYVVKLMRSEDISGICDGIPRSCCLKGNEFEELEKSTTSHDEIISAIASGKTRLCLACLIFGTPGLSSHVKFYDAYPREGTWRLGYRSMVAIDRRTGASYPGALYSVEYVEPGAQFDFTIEFRNTPNYAIGVVAEALLDLDMGLLKIGGLKSKGFGQLKIDKLDVDVHYYRREPEGLERVIPKLDPVDSDIEVGPDWRSTLNSFAKAWRNAIPCLRKISNSGWDWRTCLVQ